MLWLQFLMRHIYLYFQIQTYLCSFLRSTNFACSCSNSFWPAALNLLLSIKVCDERAKSLMIFRWFITRKLWASTNHKYNSGRYIKRIQCGAPTSPSLCPFIIPISQYSHTTFFRLFLSLLASNMKKFYSCFSSLLAKIRHTTTSLKSNKSWEQVK